MFKRFLPPSNFRVRLRHKHYNQFPSFLIRLGLPNSPLRNPNPFPIPQGFWSNFVLFGESPEDLSCQYSVHIPPELDNCMKGSMDHSFPLPVPRRTLDSELRSSEAVRRRLQSHRSQLLFELNEKDRAIELAKAEASMSARALKRFAEENQKLAAECAKLVSESKIMEKECALYESDQEALMDFANEAQQRAGDAEARVHTLEEKVLQYKHELDSYKEGGISKSKASLEDNLLESVLDMLVDKDECSSDGSTSFLETHRRHESCPKLLRMENLLTPATHKILSLAAKLERLLKEKEELRINLQRAEDEVKLLFDDNNYLDEENKMLSMFDHHGIGSGSSGGSNGSSKSNKRKSSRRMYSPIEKRSELNDVESSS